MKQILCSNWLPKWVRRPWIACFDPAQEKSAWSGLTCWG